MENTGLYSMVIALCAVVAGCKEQEQLPANIEKLGRATGPVDAPTVQPERRGLTTPDSRPAPEETIKGTVLETIDASRYTYIKIKTEAGEPVWTAVPQIRIEVGARVEVVQSVVMKDFKSQTLGRVFPTVIFGVLKAQMNTMSDMPS